MIRHNKHLKTPIGSGWDNRPKGMTYSSGVIHTTNNARPTSFAHELNYILGSKEVSYTFLISKPGEIHEIIPPRFRAWHGGACLPQFTNSRSVGIAWHCSVGERPTSQQKAAAADLVRTLGLVEQLVSTHRAVALPFGRKEDPEGMTDREFLEWRNGVFNVGTTRVIGTRPSVTRNQFSTWLRKYRAPVEPVVMDRVFELCEWLDIDPAFVGAVWEHETSQTPGRIGSSDLFKKSFNAGAIVAYGRWPKVKHNGREFNKYESVQLALMHLVMHFKQLYGANGLLDVETIIPVYAPASDNNVPASYIADVLRSMKEMQSLSL